VPSLCRREVRHGRCACRGGAQRGAAFPDTDYERALRALRYEGRGMTYTLAEIARTARRRGEHDLAVRCEAYEARRAGAQCDGHGSLVYPPTAYDLRVGESRRLHVPCDCLRCADV
jgi:hypothetical protein